MKWFRHVSDASSDEFIAILEAKFGLEGYARWWKTLEAIAKTMDHTDRCQAEYPVETWKQILRIRYDKQLKEFLLFCVAKKKLAFGSSEAPGQLPATSSEVPAFFDECSRSGVIFIKCTKLLELRDEYTRKLGSLSGYTPDTCPDNVAPEAEADKESKYTTPLPPSEPVDNFSVPKPDRIPIPKPKKEKEIVKNDFDAAAAACCELLGKRLLGPTDAGLLHSWLKHRSFKGEILPVLISKTEKFARKNSGKRPASLMYFENAIMENSA